MFAEYFRAGGPMMYVILAAWVVVLGGVLDRVAYGLYRVWRAPIRRVRALAESGAKDEARSLLEGERHRQVIGEECGVRLTPVYRSLLPRVDVQEVSVRRQNPGNAEHRQHLDAQASRWLYEQHLGGAEVALGTGELAVGERPQTPQPRSLVVEPGEEPARAGQLGRCTDRRG